MRRQVNLLISFVIAIISASNIARAQIAAPFCQGGVSVSSMAKKPTVGCGGELVGAFYNMELGVMGPQANRSELSGFASFGGFVPLYYPKRENKSQVPLLPFAQFGYTRMFDTGHAVDYGIGLIVPPKKGSNHGFVLEAKDYYVFSNPNQHNVVIRIGWTFHIQD